jgi:hypothetical protein
MTTLEKILLGFVLFWVGFIGLMLIIAALYRGAVLLWCFCRGDHSWDTCVCTVCGTTRHSFDETSSRCERCGFCSACGGTGISGYETYPGYYPGPDHGVEIPCSACGGSSTTK